MARASTTKPSKAYDEAIRLDPNYADAWNNKGIALNARASTMKPSKAYDRGHQARSQLCRSLEQQRPCSRDQGKYDEAIQAYDEAIRLDPNYAQPGTTAPGDSICKADTTNRSNMQTEP